jgi:Protein of unknown function (DUF2934)
MAETKTKRTRTTKKASKAPTHAEIAERAYYIYESEGGDQESNWLRAERELKGS